MGREGLKDGACGCGETWQLSDGWENTALSGLVRFYQTPLITDCVSVRQELVSHKVFSKVLGWHWMLRRRPLSQVTSLSFGARRRSHGKAFL